MEECKDIMAQHETFGQATSPLIERGFPAADLLPIIPPGATVVSGSAVDPKQVGKIPGRYNFHTGEWCGLTGAWPTMGISPQMVARSASWPTGNVGLRAENWPAVDIDVSSADVRDLIETLANLHLGHAPVRERGNAPRALMVFRRTGDEAIRKSRIIFEDQMGDRHAVEILGAGQQYLVAGTHPTGAEYTWREGADLAGWGQTGLAKITARDVVAFLAALTAEILTRGWRIVQSVQLQGGSSTGGVAVADLDPIVPVEVALAALRVIPNDAEVFPMREQFVEVLAAFRATVGRESLRPEIVEAVRDWATAQDWADADYFEGVWRSLTHVRVGPDRLFGLARSFGFIDDAKLDFEADTLVAEAQIAVAQDATTEQSEKLESVAKKLLYWAEQQQWIVRESGQLFSHSALNSAFGWGTEIAPAGAGGSKSAANMLINSGLVQQVVGHTYLPGKPTLTTWANKGRSALYYNHWTDAVHNLPTSASDDDVRPWLDHVEYLFDEQDDREYLLDFLGHIVQHRGQKVRWAPIIIGSQGVGKDLFLRPLLFGIAHNSQTVQPQDLTSRFIDFFERELVVVEEMLRFEKNEVYERMKAVISGTASDTLTIEKKFRMPYEIPNTVNFIFFSNHADAIALSHDDRRFFVISTQADARPDAYYTALADDFYLKQDGWKKVFVWLRQRDVSKFNPNHRPKLTNAKLEMISESQPYAAEWLADELENGIWKTRSVLLVSEIRARAASDFSIPEVVRNGLKWSNQITGALHFAKWFHRNKQVRLGKEPIRPWCRTKELAECDGELLRVRYKAEKEGKVSSVR